MKIETEPLSIWNSLNFQFPNKLSKTFASQKRHKIFSEISTPRTLELKTKKTEQYWNQLQEIIKTQTSDQSIEEQTHRKQNSILAENHYRKRKQLQSELKNNVLKEIFNESLEKKSEIKLELSYTQKIQQNRQKCKQFIQRQQFKARQSQILRQMMQFIEFGAIRK